MSFTPTQSTSVLATNTPISRSLGATFSELIGQLTPPEFRVFAPTIAAPVTETTEMIPSSIASSKPPLTVTPTFEVSTTVTATAAVVAPLPIVTPSEPQGQATTSTSTS